MPARPESSRARYSRYLRTLREARRKGEPRDDTQREWEGEVGATARRRSRTFAVLLGEFWGLLHGHRATMVAALCTVTISTLIGLALPASPKVVLDYIVADTPGPAGLPAWARVSDSREGMLWALAAVMLVATIVSVTIGMWGRWQATRLTKRVQVKLRRLAFDQAVRLPMHRVHTLKSGGVASLLREDAGGAGDLVFSLLYNPWRAVVQLAGTLAILAVVDWRLLLGALVLMPAVWMTHKAWIARIRPVYRDIRTTRQSIDAQAAETFGGMRVVRGFNRQRGEAALFVGRNHLMTRQEILAWWRSRAVDVAWSVFIPLASIAVLLYGGTQVLEGSLTVGDLMLFMTYLVMLLGPLESLASTATTIQTNLAGLDRLLDLFAEDREFAGREHGLHLERSDVRGRISLEGVTYRYPGAAADALTDVSIDIQAGETIALIGPSGSGKTTLCNLVARLDDPSSGRILLDGVDLREIDVESHRGLLGIVEQDVFLFDGSVAQNIGYARPGAAMDEIRAAAVVANADGFIRDLDRGYETVVGERGVRLSGGQKQRIAIARAILADPKILILDEATSNLDSESESLIRQSLRSLLRGRTSFVVAHRLSTVRHASRIVVLEAGRVVEVGRHEDLLARGGRYADLLRAQTEDPDEVAGAPGQPHRSGGPSRGTGAEPGAGRPTLEEARRGNGTS